MGKEGIEVRVNLSKNDLELNKMEAAIHQPKTIVESLAPQDMRLETEYLSYFPVREAMPVNVLGFKSHRDQFAIDFDKEKPSLPFFPI